MRAALAGGRQDENGEPKARRFSFVGRGAKPPSEFYSVDSNSAAPPWPPPTHIVTTPYFFLRRWSSLPIVPTSREPVMPNGWPIEIEPPFGFSFAGSRPSLSRM